MVGFDLGDIGWERVSFEEQKAFVLRVIDLAANRNRWDALAFDPPFVNRQLAELRALVNGWTEDCIEDTRTRDIWAQTDELVKCSKHDVFENAEGCLLCRDAPVG